jgi:WD repeat-containing protein 70
MGKTGAFGKGGRLSNSGTYAQYIMKSTIKNKMRDEDPREVLLSRAKEAEENPLFVSQAYSKTQPKTIFN